MNRDFLRIRESHEIIQNEMRKTRSQNPKILLAAGKKVTDSDETRSHKQVKSSLTAETGVLFLFDSVFCSLPYVDRTLNGYSDEQK